MVRQFITGYRTTPAILTDAVTVNTNAALSNHFRVTLAGNRTLANPTNPSDGQRITWEFIQDATGSRTITLGSAFAAGNLIVSLSTAATKHDFMDAVYNATTAKWYILAFNKGY